MAIRVRILLVLVALCGAAVALFASAPGIGLSPDSAAYIGAARGLLAGIGLGSPAPNGGFRPLLFYAPLFPTLLAAIGALGIDPLDAARYLNSALFGANVFLSGIIISRDTGSRSAAVIGSILLLLSIPMLKVHSMAWSEPTFIFFTLLALLWLSGYVERGGTGWVIAAATAVGLADLSRYAGLFLIPAGIAVVLGFGPQQSSWKALRDCAVFTVISGLISSGALIRNWIVGRTLTDHPTAVHLVGTGHLQRGLHTLGRWFWMDARPGTQALAVLAIAGCGLLLVAMGNRRQHATGTTQLETRSRESSAAARTALTISIAYGLFLSIAISFFDAATLLDDRLLSPTFAWGVIAGVCGARGWVATARRWGMAGGLVVCAGMWFAAAQLSQSVPWVIDVHQHGQGYARSVWRGSEALARVRALPPATCIFSNGDDVIYLLTGRLAERLPERRSLNTAEPNDRYAAELARMHRRLAEAHGVIVYLSPVDWRPNLVTAAEIQSSMALQPIYVAADGVIYAVKD